jgi:hypothetical protein
MSLNEPQIPLINTGVPKSCGRVVVQKNNLLNFMFLPFVICMDMRTCGIKKIGCPSFPLPSQGLFYNSVPV